MVEVRGVLFEPKNLVVFPKGAYLDSYCFLLHISYVEKQCPLFLHCNPFPYRG